MTAEEQPQPRWAVICDNYVSHHADRSDALLHMRAISGKQCKALHAVKLTLMPSGSRIREEKK